MSRLRVAACQIDTRVGALEHNRERILTAIERAAAERCDLIVFPEFTLTGNPADDLLAKDGFVADTRRVLDEIAATIHDRTVLIGFVAAEPSPADRIPEDPATDGDAIVASDDAPSRWSAIAVCTNGAVVATVGRRTLLDGGIHQDHRHLVPAPAGRIVHRIRGLDVAVVVGADAARPDALADAPDADLIVVPRAEPYAAGEPARRHHLMTQLVGRSSRPALLVNRVGGQDDLVFDGGSLALDGHGTPVGRARQFAEDLLIVDVDAPTDGAGAGITVPATTDRPAVAPALPEDEEVYRAIETGLRGYLRKNGFGRVVVGLSGGMDSALAAVIAADAIGGENVHGILMPSRFSTDHSITDAVELADNLGMPTTTIPIEAGHHAVSELLTPVFGRRPDGVADQNIQSRLRGLILMALANENGWLVLSTSNKSEIAVGYTTLYGDSIGGYGVLKDLYKSRVYDLARWRNTIGTQPVIPKNIITKPPSAELAPGQLDDQSLPPYDVLDPILHGYLEENRTAAELVSAGHDPAVVDRVTRLVDGAEFKRGQAPIGARVSTAAFGRGRRFPITNGYR